MVTFKYVMSADLGKLQTAATEWKLLPEKYRELKTSFEKEVRNPLRATWTGEAATAAKTFITKAMHQYDAAATEAELVGKILQDTYDEFSAIQKKLKKIVEEDAPTDRLRVSESGVITNAAPPLSQAERHDPDYPQMYARERREKMEALAQRIIVVLQEATDADAAASHALRRDANGEDNRDFNKAAFASLDEAIVNKLILLLKHGGDLTDAEREQIKRNWTNLDPAARASLWSQARDELISAGVTDPKYTWHSPDSGAGEYDSAGQGLRDVKTLGVAWGLAFGGDFKEYENASRNMAHYLSATGEPLEVDPSAMLRDDEQLRTTVSGVLADHDGEWRKQALDAFKESGGRPVSIPVETGRFDYTFPTSNRDWYLAIGSGAYDVTGVVTAEPDGNGQPKVSMDYQLHTWDRYNWDAGKSTDITDGINVTDAEMARLHRVGLAQEYDVYGHSDVMTRELGSGDYNPAPITAPPDDGSRENERTDPNRDQNR